MSKLKARNQNNQHPATNRILTVNGSSTGVWYDAAGNLTGDGSASNAHTFQWDAENRLRSVDNGNTASYVYNALGQRVEKIGGGQTTYYYHDSSGNIAMNESTALEQTHVNEYFFPTVAGRNYAKYYWTGSAWETDYLHANPLESTQLVTRSDNTYLEMEVFLPFGRFRWSGGVASTRDVRFAGMQERDLETTTWQDPLDSTPNRTYTSGLGRWLSPDPLAGDITNPQSLNRYAYALNNPTSLVDPLGLDSCNVNNGSWEGDGNPFPCGPGNQPSGQGPSPEPPPGCDQYDADPACDAPTDPPPPLFPVFGGGGGGGLPMPGDSGPLSGDYGANLPPLGPAAAGVPCDFGPCGPGAGGLGFMSGEAILTLPVVFRSVTWACALDPAGCVAAGIAGAGAALLGWDLYQGYRLAQAYGHFPPKATAVPKTRVPQLGGFETCKLITEGELPSGGRGCFYKCPSGFPLVTPLGPDGTCDPFVPHNQVISPRP